MRIQLVRWATLFMIVVSTCQQEIQEASGWLYLRVKSINITLQNRNNLELKIWANFRNVTSSKMKTNFKVYSIENGRIHNFTDKLSDNKNTNKIKYKGEHNIYFWLQIAEKNYLNIWPSTIVEALTGFVNENITEAARLSPQTITIGRNATPNNTDFIKIQLEFWIECEPGWFGKACTTSCTPFNSLTSAYSCSEKGQRICVPNKPCLFGVCENKKCLPSGFCTTNLAGNATCICSENKSCKLTSITRTCNLENCQPPLCNCNSSTTPTPVNPKRPQRDRCQLHNPCKNGGVCVSNNGDSSLSYSCKCKPPYFGTHCSHKRDICELEKPCLNHGHCVDINETSYECSCVGPYLGQNCQVINYCYQSAVTCRNGGTCINDPTNFKCNCTSKWKGKNCEIPFVAQCPNCLNNGTCRSSPDNQTLVCDCTENFTGPLCQTPLTPATTMESACKLLKPCNNGGICEQIDSVNLDSFKCHCLKGFSGPTCNVHLSTTEHACNNKCTNRGVCTVLKSGTSFCKCSEGYYGRKCHRKRIIKIKSCPSSSNPCVHDNSCYLHVNGSTYCVCSKGFSGQHCEFSSVMVDPCSTNPCGMDAKCVTSDHVTKMFSCVCSPGFTGHLCTMRTSAHKMIGHQFMWIGLGVLVVVVIVGVLFCITLSRRKAHERLGFLKINNSMVTIQSNDKRMCESSLTIDPDEFNNIYDEHSQNGKLIENAVL